MPLQPAVSSSRWVVFTFGVKTVRLQKIIDKNAQIALKMHSIWSVNKRMALLGTIKYNCIPDLASLEEILGYMFGRCGGEQQYPTQSTVITLLVFIMASEVSS